MKKDDCPNCDGLKCIVSKQCRKCWTAGSKTSKKWIFLRWEQAFILECGPFLTVNEMLQYIKKPRVQIIMRCRELGVTPPEEE